MKLYLYPLLSRVVQIAIAICVVRQHSTTYKRQGQAPAPYYMADGFIYSFVLQRRIIYKHIMSEKKLVFQATAVL